MSSVMDAVVDRFARRPRGMFARRFWRDPKAHHEIFRSTLAALDLQQDDNLLEIGCGGGTFVNWALGTGCRATAVDHSADMVALTESGNRDAVAAQRLTVVQASADRLSLPDCEFTCAALMNVLFFLDEPAVLAEVHRVLRPGGRLVIHTVAAEPPRNIAPPPLAKRMRLHSDDELIALVDGVGFVKTELTRIDGVYQLVSATKA